MLVAPAVPVQAEGYLASNQHASIKTRVHKKAVRASILFVVPKVNRFRDCSLSLSQRVGTLPGFLI